MNMVNDEKKKVTIYSVAHEAGVSLATVSRVINDSSLVKPETKRKVEEAIVKLGYRPNAVAQGLALKKTTVIALVIPDSSFISMGKIMNGLLDVAKIYKYNIMLHTSSSSINEMDEIIDNIVKSRADGVIVYNDVLTNEQVATLNTYHVPLVYIGNGSMKTDICNVFVNYKREVSDLVTKYLNRGVSDIVFVEDRKNELLMNYVIEGITEAFEKQGKEFDGLIKIPEYYKNSYGYLNEYFENHKHKVVMTLRDSQAAAVLNACRKNNISIPEETDLICIIDSRYNEMIRPRISSFDNPAYDLGALAMRIMTKMLSGEDNIKKEYPLSCPYRGKDSTKI